MAVLLAVNGRIELLMWAFFFFLSHGVESCHEAQGNILNRCNDEQLLQ